MNTIETIKKHKIIAIARKVPKDKILQTAEALFAGGIRLLEVTFDQNNPHCIVETSDMIGVLVKRFGTDMCIGAGTVMTITQAEAAVNAGAQYLISPNFSPAIVKKTLELSAISIPGALTPTEIVAAYEAGAQIVKLFPAGDLGVGYIKSIISPLSHIPMMAVGGIDEKNIADFLKTGLRGVGIGSNIVKNSLIEQNRFSELTELAKKYTSIIL